MKSKGIKIQAKLQESTSWSWMNTQLAWERAGRLAADPFVAAGVKEKGRTQIFMCCMSSFATSLT